MARSHQPGNGQRQLLHRKLAVRAWTACRDLQSQRLKLAISGCLLSSLVQKHGVWAQRPGLTSLQSRFGQLRVISRMDVVSLLKSRRAQAPHYNMKARNVYVGTHTEATLASSSWSTQLDVDFPLYRVLFDCAGDYLSRAAWIVARLYRKLAVTTAENNRPIFNQPIQVAPIHDIWAENSHDRPHQSFQRSWLMSTLNEQI